MSDGVTRVARTVGARVADLRIAVPAVSAWGASAVLVGSPDRAVLVVVAAGVVAAVGIVLLFVRGIGGGGAVSLAAVVTIVVTTTLLVALVSVAVAVGQERRSPGVLTDPGGRSAVQVTIDRDLERGARSVTGTLTAADGVSALHVPVRLVPDGDASAPGRLAAGSTVHGTASVEQDDPGSPTAFVVFLRGSVRVDPPTGLLAATDRSRQAFVAVTADLPEPGAALLRGMAIGDRSGLDPATEAAMETTALTHLTAVSGANCAVIVGLVVLLGRSLGLPRVVRAAVAVGFMLAFVVLVRPDPSIVRATVMAVVVLVVHLSGRPVRGVPLIALAVVGMLTIDPWYSRSFAFALSVLATSGIVVLAPPLTALLARRVWPPVAAAVAVPVVAQVACWPVTILLAPHLPTYGVPANLLAEPLAPVVTVLGLASCLVAPVWPGGAGVVAGVAWVPASVVGHVARTASTFPGASAPWPSGPSGLLLAVVVCGGVAVAVFVGTSVRVRLLLASAVVLVVGVGAVGVPRLVVRGSVPADWTVAACDVGQGDAVLLRSGTAVALVDTGDEPELLRACLDLLRVDRIALLVLTHFDRDHVGAVPEVAGSVTTALVGPVGRPADDRVVQGLRQGGADVLRAAAGTSVGLGRLLLDVVWPLPTATESGNDASVVLRVGPRDGETTGLSALLLGDLGESAQRRMRTSSRSGGGGLEPVDVVKVSHHGSADQDAGLYRAIRAPVALIGVGADNSYGHPTRRSLDLLAATGTVVYRTDVHGTVVLAPAADGPRVWTERSSGSSGAESVVGPRVRRPTSGVAGRLPASVGRPPALPVDFRRRRPTSVVAGRLPALPVDFRRCRSTSGVADRLPALPVDLRRRRSAVGSSARAAHRRSQHRKDRMPARKPARAAAKIDQVPWSGVRPAPVVLVTGPEAFLADRAISVLRDLLVGEDPALEIHDLEADQYAPGLLATLASPSLFGEPRLVRVTNVEKCTDAFITETIAYLEGPADDVTLVLRHGGGMRGKKLLDTIRSGVGGGVEVQCDELKRETDRVDFVNAEFRAARRKIAPSAVRTLVAAFADDLAELAAACRQLLADSAEEITDKVVDKYYGGRVETNAFKVADIALAGRSAPAIVELRHALATGEAPVPIVAAFASKIRTMAKVSAFRGSSGQAASALGMAPWQVQRAQRDVAGWSEAGLANAILSIAAADTAVKGGSRDAHYALEVMVRTIARRGEDR